MSQCSHGGRASVTFSLQHRRSSLCPCTVTVHQSVSVWLCTRQRLQRQLHGGRALESRTCSEYRRRETADTLLTRKAKLTVIPRVCHAFEWLPGVKHFARSGRLFFPLRAVALRSSTPSMKPKVPGVLLHGSDLDHEL